MNTTYTKYTRLFIFFILLLSMHNLQAMHDSGSSTAWQCLKTCCINFFCCPCYCISKCCKSKSTIAPIDSTPADKTMDEKKIAVDPEAEQRKKEQRKALKQAKIVDELGLKLESSEFDALQKTEVLEQAYISALIHDDSLVRNFITAQARCKKYITMDQIQAIDKVNQAHKVLVQ